MFGVDSHGPFAIDAPAEVAAWLRRLERQATPLSVSAAGGAGLSTTIWRVDAEHARLALDASGGGAALAGIVGAEDVTAVAYADAVKLQFDLHDLMLVHGAGSSALQAALPARLYRFQRRDAYRVPAAAHAGPAAEFRHPAVPEIRLALRVLDVSASGCALLLPDDMPAVPAGIAIAGARLRLDSSTVFDATLQVLHVGTIQPGTAGIRLGCTLAGLNADAACALQRYVDRVQRRRRPFGG